MSSNKNLKVYRIQFITQFKQMIFKVKFPCQIKIVWKRSNQSAQTSLVPVKDGIVSFNQTLKIYVNMYYDITTNKFVQKKCIYNFLIITQKGQKSAGNITYDLSQFFNKRVYEIQEDFSLQKCPLPDTKIKMKIYYEQSSEQGYDSMSKISTTNQQMDISGMSLDISQLQQKNSSTIEKESVEKKNIQKEQQSMKQSKYEMLSESDVGSNRNSTDTGIQSSNQQIVALSKLTGKINDFVFKCSGNIRTQVQSLKLKIKNTQQELQGQKILRQKIERENKGFQEKLLQKEKQFKNYRQQNQMKLKNQNLKVQELESKLSQSQNLCSQLQNNMSEKGQSQKSYISQLKSNFQKDQAKLKQTILQSQQNLLEEKKIKNQLLQNKQILQKRLGEFKEKLSQQMQRNKVLEQKQKQRERQLEQVRMKMEDVYQNMVSSLGVIFK